MHTVENEALNPRDLSEDESDLGSGPVPEPLPRWRAGLLVAAGGALGSVVRLAAASWLAPTLTPTLVSVPWSTLTVNLLGTLLLGVLAGFQEHHHGLPRWVWPMLGIGLLGGFTTMSTVVLEWSAMIGSRFSLLALGYGAGTLVGTLLAAVAGIVVGGLLEQWWTRRVRGRGDQPARSSQEAR